MKRKITFIVAAFLIGGLGYACIELLWRGRTHWSMIITGGLCMSIMFMILQKHRQIGIVYRGLLGAVVITAVEFVAGYIVNIWLDLKIWDYSDQKWNLMGQICPLYSLFWCILSVPVSKICIKLNTIYDG
ncbi:MAG: hypothetical protein IIY78_02430 [Clostridia bacterium]|nr:hypothetical protein [Clostridia bacterium]